MTVHPAGGFRGHFDPIGLGLHAPAYFDEMKWQDEVSTADWSTFIHELSHYLQFYGTALGIGYVKTISGRSRILEKIISRMVTRGVRSCPVSQAGVDLRLCVDSEEELQTFTLFMMAWRYFKEEFYGWTFPEFSLSPIATAPGVPLITSTFYVADDQRAYPILGEALLEGQAAANEAMFLHNHSPSQEIADKLFQRYFVGLNGADCAKYNGIAVYLHAVRLSHLKEIIFFILLNQPWDDIFGKLGQYSLIWNLRKIFRAFDKIGELQTPSNEAELLAAIEKICNKANLKNPFAVLKALGASLADENKERGQISAINWIAHRAIKWQLENKFQALFWPIEPQSLIWSVPLMKLCFRRAANPEMRDGGYVDFPNFRREDLGGKRTDEEIHRWQVGVLEAHLNLSVRTYIATGLFENAKTRCPFFMWEKPSISDCCSECSGFFPNKSIRQDCTVSVICEQMGLESGLVKMGDPLDE